MIKDINDMTIEELEADILKDNPNYVFPKPKYRMNGNIIESVQFININETNIMNMKKVKIKEPDPTQYIFYPCLPPQGIGFIYAATGVGKTFFSLNLAYAIAAGGSFLKYTCPKPRKVMYIDGEMAYRDIYSRLIQIEKIHGELDFEDNFQLITPDTFGMKVFKIDDAAGQDAYERIFNKYDIEVVVFDNLSVLSSIDENKAKEWAGVQEWLLRLRALGKTVIVVHHAGKDKNGYRGTSRMLDCADFAISLQPVNEEQLDSEITDAKKFNIIYHKARAFYGSDAATFEATLEKGEWSHKSTEQTLIGKIIERCNAGMSQREIAKDLCVSQPYVNKLIKRSKYPGLIKKQ